jgi:uncharacterized protein with HEPN domain
LEKPVTIFPKNLRKNIPTLIFRPAVSMRNQLIHGYDDIDLEVVWNTVTGDLPILKEQLSGLI